MNALGVADDLGVLCEVVGLDRVAMLGISAGAPFAMACAVRLPQRVGSLLLSSPMGPWELPETHAGMSRRNRRYLTLAHRAPALSRAACWLWARMALVGLRGDRDRLLRRLSKALPPADQQVLAEVAADPQRWDRFVDDTAEAFRQGGVGVCADLAVASRPWGFQLQEVIVPTWLWHGAADEDVPIAAARRMAQAIPHCHASFTDEGHLMGLRHAAETIRRSQGRRQPSSRPSPRRPQQPAATSAGRASCLRQGRLGRQRGAVHLYHRHEPWVMPATLVEGNFLEAYPALEGLSGAALPERVDGDHRALGSERLRDRCRPCPRAQVVQYCSFAAGRPPPMPCWSCSRMP